MTGCTSNVWNNLTASALQLPPPNALTMQDQITATQLSTSIQIELDSSSLPRCYHGNTLTFWGVDYGPTLSDLSIAVTDPHPDLTDRLSAALPSCVAISVNVSAVSCRLTVQQIHPLHAQLLVPARKGAVRPTAPAVPILVAFVLVAERVNIEAVVPVAALAVPPVLAALWAVAACLWLACCPPLHPSPPPNRSGRIAPPRRYNLAAG